MKKYRGVAFLLCLLVVSVAIKFTGIMAVATPLDPNGDLVAEEIIDTPEDIAEEVDDPAASAKPSPTPSASATPGATNVSAGDGQITYTNLIRVYIGSQSVVAYRIGSDGSEQVLRAMICSTGVGNATPRGTFKLGVKYRWHSLMGGVYGQYCSRITSSVLFHSVPYSTKDPTTMNRTSYGKLGSKASHGCIRLLCRDALWIYNNMPSGTKIEITTGSGPRGSKPALLSAALYGGWDPTDPDPSNPYHSLVPTATPSAVPSTTPSIAPTPTHTALPSVSPASPPPVGTPSVSPSESASPSPAESTSPSPSVSPGP